MAYESSSKSGSSESQWQIDERLRASLELERTSFLSHWRDLSDFILPRRSRFTITDVNRGDRRNQKIIDSTATIAARTLRSGMMAGVTSPSRPWFRLTTAEPFLAELGDVKAWLHLVTQRMEDVFRRSNLYNSLPVIYGDLGVFGTAALYIEEDFTGKVLRTMPFPIGSYMVGLNERLVVDVLVREFQMTVRQIVQTFFMENRTIQLERANKYIRDLWERGERETWVQVVHVIQPNDDYDPNKFGSQFKRYRSCYYERGLSGTNQQIATTDQRDHKLRESGYDYFPVLCPRWETTGEDAYGTSCPGMESLGDVKQMQLGERRIMQAIEKSVNPPMTGPSALKTLKASVLPGDLTYLDIREGQQGFRPVYQIDPRVQEMEGKQEQARQRIRRVFFEDLFLMLATDPRKQPPTAREIDERHEEKLLALGPVLEQLNQDLLDPLIDVTFAIMLRQGLIPDPPEDLQGRPLKVEYVSIMAQAQKLVGLAGLERLAGFVLEASKVVPDILDKLDTDQMVDVVADRLGVDPGVTRTDEAVEEIRAQRAKAQQAAATLEALHSGSEVAKNLAGSDLESDNALKRLVEGGAPA